MGYASSLYGNYYWLLRTITQRSSDPSRSGFWLVLMLGEHGHDGLKSEYVWLETLTVEIFFWVSTSLRARRRDRVFQLS